MSVVVRRIGRCSFPLGEISSLMMHERTWGTPLSIVANCITIDRRSISAFRHNRSTYDLHGNVLRTALRGWQTSVEKRETWEIDLQVSVSALIKDGAEPRSNPGRNDPSTGGGSVGWPVQPEMTWQRRYPPLALLNTTPNIQLTCNAPRGQSTTKSPRV